MVLRKELPPLTRIPILLAGILAMTYAIVTFIVETATGPDVMVEVGMFVLGIFIYALGRYGHLPEEYYV